MLISEFAHSEPSRVSPLGVQDAPFDEVDVLNSKTHVSSALSLLINSKLAVYLRTMRKAVASLIRSFWRQSSIARRTVFVDCGSNTCRVLRARIERGLEAEFFAFEPQPGLAAHVDSVRREYPSVPVHFFNKAVWVHDGSVDLYLATRWGPNYKGGSTILEGKSTNEVDYSHPISVECIDFSRWIARTFRKEDHLVIKMDIEGAEYAVLEKMIADGAIDCVAELLVEFHWEKNEQIGKGRHEALVAALKDRVVISDWQ